jgi:NAD(P)-dependent dehydrogenase (short-subunit alcohol dehydrogenase family)
VDTDGLDPFSQQLADAPTWDGRGAPLHGKRVVVTGAGDGLGRAYAIYLAGQGVRVVVNDIDASKAGAVADEILAAGGTARSVAASVAEWDQAGQIVDLCVSAFGGIDGLVNNAGVVRVEPPWSAEPASIRAMIEINLMGTVFVGVHAINKMVDQGHGSIVNITSSAQLGLPALGVYGATKGAIASLTYSWALDLASHGVRVNAYSPLANTAMTVNNPIPSGWMPSPADNAPVVAYLLSDLCAGVTGQVVQRRGESLVVMAHPQLTGFAAFARSDTLERLHGQFGAVLRAGRQPVGDPRVRPVGEPDTAGACPADHDEGGWYEQ